MKWVFIISSFWILNWRYPRYYVDTTPTSNYSRIF